MKRIWSILIVTAALSIAASVPARTAKADIIDRIVAIVNDEVITLSDVLRILPIYIQVVGVDLRSLDSSESRNELANEVVDHLVDTSLIVSDAEDRDLAVSEDEVGEYLAERQSAMGLTADEFAAALEMEGILMDDFADFMQDNLTRLRMIQLDVIAQISISDERIEQEIAERYPDGLFEVYLTTSHILVQVGDGVDDATALAAIQDIEARLAAGEAFEDIAAAVNPDGSANRGGRVGRFRTGTLDGDYERAAMALDAGEVSEPVRTQFGYHLIRLEGREEEPIDDAEEIADEIYFELQQAEASRQESLYLERLRDDAYVQVLVSEFGL